MNKVKDNSNIILPLLEFQEGYLYHLVILVRKKDKESEKFSSLIRDYYIDSKEYFDRKYPEILGLVEYFKGRAYVNLRRVEKSKIGLNLLKATVHKIESGDNSFTKIISKAVGMSYDKSNLKKWVIDIDSLDQSVLENTKNILSTQCGVDILAEYSTKNGYHLITNGFDTRGVNFHPLVDIKREGGCALIAFFNQ